MLALPEKVLEIWNEEYWFESWFAEQVPLPESFPGVRE